MAIYVDPLRECGPVSGWRWKFACHMVADSLEELNAFAGRLGLCRSWLQGADKPLPHYDLIERRRARAVQLGAVEISAREMGQKARDARLAKHAEESTESEGG